MKVNHNTMQKKCIKILVRVIFSFQTNEFFFFILKNNLKILNQVQVTLRLFEHWFELNPN